MSRDVLLTDVWGYQHVTCRGIDLVIGFVSPASTPSQEGIRRGIEILAGWGLRVETGTHAFDTRDHYLAGRDENRLAEINAALRDPGIRAIFATTGGKGAYRMIVRPIPLRSTRWSAS